MARTIRRYGVRHNAPVHTDTNPFTYGDLALDESFTDREDEVRELASDMRNGQNVLVYAPRRYGKSSLVLRAAQEVISDRVLVGYCDLMRTPTKERLAAALAKTIWSDIASPVDQALEKAASLFRGLRIVPSMDVDPTDGSLRFGFQAGRRKVDIDETIERLLELPAEIAAERKRRVVLVLDEFQEVVALDKQFPNLMRAVFQAQPEVGHVYLGSKRHVLERIFSDRNEPFWRSAKRLEIGPIPAEQFSAFLRERFTATGRALAPDAAARLLRASGGHPYGTQELAYSTWELVPEGGVAGVAEVEAALVKVLRSEHNHFTGLWEEASRPQRLALLALASEPTAGIYASAYRERHPLPPTPTLQTAVKTLVARELVARDEDGTYRIVEPFFAEWLEREQREYGVPREVLGGA